MMPLLIWGGSLTRNECGQGEEAEMIMRSWSGRATAAGADSYVAYFRETSGTEGHGPRLRRPRASRDQCQAVYVFRRRYVDTLPVNGLPR